MQEAILGPKGEAERLVMRFIMPLNHPERLFPKIWAELRGNLGY